MTRRFACYAFYYIRCMYIGAYMCECLSVCSTSFTCTHNPQARSEYHAQSNTSHHTYKLTPVLVCFSLFLISVRSGSSALMRTLRFTLQQKHTRKPWPKTRPLEQMEQSKSRQQRCNVANFHSGLFAVFMLHCFELLRSFLRKQKTQHQTPTPTTTTKRKSQFKL